MPAVLHTLPQAARVLVIRLKSLGDCVLTTPALRLLKQARPDLRVAVMVEQRFAAVFEGNPDVEAILDPGPKPAFSWRPALTLNLHGGPRSAALTAASMARLRAGFGHFRFQSLYNLRIPRAQEILGEKRTVHTAEHLASAMFWLGVPRTEIPRACLYAEGRDARCERAVVHPFASAAHKSWPAEKFAALANHLQRDVGLKVTIIGGAADDFAPFGEFECLRGAPLRDVKALLAGARIFVGNDSGPAHMAAAFGLPVVVLYGSSDAGVWAPWRTESQVIAAGEGLAAVPLERVTAAVDKLRARA